MKKTWGVLGAGGVREPATRRTMKAAIAAVLAAGSVFAAAGCSGQGSVADSKAPLSIWVSDVNHNEAWEAALADFSTETGVAVTPTFYQNDQYKQQIANATGTSTMPDLFVQWSGIGLLGNIYDAGAIEPMDSYFDDYKWGDRFNETAVASITLDEKKMGVPFIVQKMAVVYKKSTFAAAGITPPTTFAELQQVNEAFKAKGITPWSFAGKNSWNTMRLADSLIETTCGAKEFDNLRELKSDWKSSTCAEEGFQTLSDWVANGYLVKDYMGLDPNANEMWKPIVDGTAAMTIDGNWSTGTITSLGENPSDYGFFAFPSDSNRLNYFASSIYMTSTSKNKEGAARLSDFLTKKEVVEKYPGILNNAVSATQGVTPASSGTYDAAWVELGNTMSGVYGPSDQAFPPDVAQAFLLNNDKLQLGQMKPAEVVAAIEQAAETYKASK